MIASRWNMLDEHVQLTVVNAFPELFWQEDPEIGRKSSQATSNLSELGEVIRASLG